MTGAVANAGQFIAALDKYEERFHKMFRRKIRMLLHEGMRRLTSKTPVHTGQAVASYVASSGSPKGIVRSGGKPQPGTNKMPLGSERNRGSATATAMATLSSVDFSDPYKAYYITNAAPQIMGLELGNLPKAPYQPRSPAGMFGVTVQELLALLHSGSV